MRIWTVLLSCAIVFYSCESDKTKVDRTPEKTGSGKRKVAKDTLSLQRMYGVPDVYSLLTSVRGSKGLRDTSIYYQGRSVGRGSDLETAVLLGVRLSDLVALTSVGSWEGSIRILEKMKVFETQLQIGDSVEFRVPIGNRKSVYRKYGPLLLEKGRTKSVELHERLRSRGDLDLLNAMRFGSLIESMYLAVSERNTYADDQWRQVLTGFKYAVENLLNNMAGSGDKVELEQFVLTLNNILSLMDEMNVATSDVKVVRSGNSYHVSGGKRFISEKDQVEELRILLKRTRESFEGVLNTSKIK